MAHRPAVTAYFSHPNTYVGDLAVENGLDQAQWSYNLNTQVYPTYGGEVVQILSVNIGDITIGGSLTTYRQAQLVYSYFARYFQIATQGSPGKTGNSAVDSGRAYNQLPMTFRYPMRGWDFKLQPKSAPGFRYDVELVNPIWVMTAHVVDANNEGGGLTAIRQQIMDSAVSDLMADSGFNKLNDQISPNSDDPNTNPFQTYYQPGEQAETALGGLADYYASLVDGFENNNYSSITNGVGSKPATKKIKGKKNSGTQTVNHSQAGHAH